MVSRIPIQNRCFSNRSIGSINGALKGQSGPGSNGNEVVTPHSPRLQNWRQVSVIPRISWFAKAALHPHLPPLAAEDAVERILRFVSRVGFFFQGSSLRKLHYSEDVGSTLG